MTHLLIEQVFSQRTWPKAGDIDDCWVVSTIQSVNAVAPWLPLLDVTEFRAFAGDPDDGKADGGNVPEIMAGITGAYPKLAPLCAAVRGWTWDRFLLELKLRKVATVGVMSNKLPQPLGFLGPHQVTYIFEPGVGLYIANPLAPDRSEPIRIATASARAAMEAHGMQAVLMPSPEDAFKTHPLYVAPSTGKYTEAQYQAGIAAAKLEVSTPLTNRIQAIKGKVAANAADIADD